MSGIGGDSDSDDAPPEEFTSQQVCLFVFSFRINLELLNSLPDDSFFFP